MNKWNETLFDELEKARKRIRWLKTELAKTGAVQEEAARVPELETENSILLARNEILKAGILAVLTQKGGKRLLASAMECSEGWAVDSESLELAKSVFASFAEQTLPGGGPKQRPAEEPVGNASIEG